MIADNIYPWQQSIWQKLNEQIEKGRLSHALLLTGPEGIGKLTFAEHLAHRLLCQSPENGEPCGHCRSCQLWDSGHHPDRAVISPAEAGKAIKVDQVRELSEVLHSTAQQGGYRVVIMQPAEAMNTAAANALLKTLEEPGRDTLLMLICHQLGQIMPTIRSRCQRIDFPLPDLHITTEWVSKELKTDSDTATNLLRVAQGAPLEAVALKNDGRLEIRRELMKALADILRDRVDVPNVAQKLYKSDVLSILEWWLSLLSDIVRGQSRLKSAELVNTDMVKMITAVAKEARMADIFSMMDRVQQARTSLMQRQNPNLQLLLEKLLFDWSALMRR